MPKDYHYRARQKEIGKRVQKDFVVRPAVGNATLAFDLPEGADHRIIATKSPKRKRRKKQAQTLSTRETRQDDDSKRLLALGRKVDLACEQLSQVSNCLEWFANNRSLFGSNRRILLKLQLLRKRVDTMSKQLSSFGTSAL